MTREASGSSFSLARKVPAILLALAVLAGLTLLLLGLLVHFSNTRVEPESNGSTINDNGSTLALPPGSALQPVAPTRIRAIWANEGGEKIMQEETRLLKRSGRVVNSVWNGKQVSLFGAGNETVSLALIMETADKAATDIEVSFTHLENRTGSRISGDMSNPRNLFFYPGKNIELFHVGYLAIKGLSKGLAYDTYDERHVPSKCQRRHKGGAGMGSFLDRPCANRHFPDIATPLILKSPFSIRPHQSQMIWVDIYIPENTAAGRYTGSIVVSEKGRKTWSIPVDLQVRGFTLPETPSARTMIALTNEDINERYLGVGYPERGSARYKRSGKIIDRHFQLAHRHRLSLVDGYTQPQEMDASWLKRLDGSLFTREHGYAGTGEGIGNNVYAIGLYGSWPWKGQGRKAMWENTDQWVQWFKDRRLNAYTDFFLYLDDESEDYEELETWARWMDINPGTGSTLDSMATVDLTQALVKAPSLDIPAAAANIGIRQQWQAAASKILQSDDKKLYLYNGRRPATGSFAIEDDGVSLRQLAWAQYKLKVDRWFYWNGTYYNNVQCAGSRENETRSNVFIQAKTFGCTQGNDRELGETGFNYFNGDGVLFYPGTDKIYPKQSLGIDGPVASLRLKYWRRGLQDVDYLHLAAAIDPVKTARIVNRLIPRVAWEYGIQSRRDPSWIMSDISWPIDPDQWEEARRELADLVESGQEPEK
jgi:hypothetical protein